MFKWTFKPNCLWCRGCKEMMEKVEGNYLSTLVIVAELDGKERMSSTLAETNDFLDKVLWLVEFVYGFAACEL